MKTMPQISLADLNAASKADFVAADTDPRCTPRLIEPPIHIPATDPA